MRTIQVMFVAVVLGTVLSATGAAEKPPGSAAARQATGVSTRGKPAASPAVDDGWPDTREGALGRRWVAAFVSGEEAMREFYIKDLAEKSLQEKGMEGRLSRYRELRERFGKLVFGAVEKSQKGELTVTLIDADAASHKFVFRAQTEAPFKLINVGMLQTRTVGHGGGGGFHH